VAISVTVEDLNLINRLEALIIERLQDLTELGAKVIAHPSYATSGRTVPQGLLSVAYVRSAFGPAPTRIAPQQEEEIQFQVSWRLRDLRSHAEVYPLSRAVVHLLRGWRPLNCFNSAFYPKNIELLEQDEEGYWPLFLLFGIRILIDAS